MRVNKKVLDNDAQEYYLNENKEDKFVKEKFIEYAHQEYCMKWLSGFLDEKTNVLAMGYGDGVQAKILYESCNKLTIVEGSNLLTEKASSDLKNATCIHALFEEFNPKEKFDVIIATFVFEHVDNPVVLLRMMKNWINDEGKIIIVVPNQESIHRKLAVLMGLQPKLDTLSERDINVGHQRVYSFNTLEQDARDAGFRVDLRYAFTLKSLPNSMMLNYPETLIRALNEISQEIPMNLLANIGIVIKK
jgi:2-polyprenyl-3-methyl-5-hydroxy-6-metoxy-1,4-benzoquinol methylase